MKNSQAKTKICPFMSDNTMGKDTQGKYNGVSYCVCEDCMAWEITLDTKKEKSLIAIKQFGKTTAIDGIKEVPLEKEKHEGFCKRLGK